MLDNIKSSTTTQWKTNEILIDVSDSNNEDKLSFTYLDKNGNTFTKNILMKSFVSDLQGMVNLINRDLSEFQNVLFSVLYRINVISPNKGMNDIYDFFNINNRKQFWLEWLKGINVNEDTLKEKPDSEEDLKE